MSSQGQASYKRSIDVSLSRAVLNAHHKRDEMVAASEGDLTLIKLMAEEFRVCSSSLFP